MKQQSTVSLLLVAVVLLNIVSTTQGSNWKKLQDLIVNPVVNFGSTQVGSDIYVMGGTWNYNLNIQKFDTNTYEWTYNYSPIPTAANSIARIGNQYIYFFPLAGCEVHRYDIFQDIWELNITTPPNCFSDRIIRPITIMRNFEEEIYLFHYDTEKAESVKYNPQTDTWTSITSIPSELTYLWGFDVATDDQQQYIFAVGGRSNVYPYGESSKTFYYHIDSDVWYQTSNMNIERGYSMVLEQKDQFLYVFGGSHFESKDCSIERLDISGILSTVGDLNPGWEPYDTIPPDYCQILFSGSLIGDFFFLYGGVDMTGSAVSIYSLFGYPLPEIPEPCSPSGTNINPSSALEVSLSEDPDSHFLVASVPIDIHCIAFAPIKQLPTGMENCGNGNLNLLWFKINAQPDSYQLSVSTCNSEFDTLLFVLTEFAENMNDEFVFQSCNDDYSEYPPSCNEFTSGVTIPHINAGNNIYIGVSAYNQGSTIEGYGLLEISLSPITTIVDSSSILQYLETNQTPILLSIQSEIISNVIPKVDNITSSLTSLSTSFSQFQSLSQSQNSQLSQTLNDNYELLNSTSQTIDDIIQYVTAIDDQVSSILQNTNALLGFSASLLNDTTFLVSSVTSISSLQNTIYSDLQSITNQVMSVNLEIIDLEAEVYTSREMLNSSINSWGSSLTSSITNLNSSFTSTLNQLESDLFSKINLLEDVINGNISSLDNSIQSSITDLLNNLTSYLNSRFSNVESQLSSVSFTITNYLSSTITPLITSTANNIQTLIRNNEFENALINGNTLVSNRYKSPAEMGGYLEDLATFVQDTYNYLKSQAQQISLISTSPACQNSALCTFFYKAEPTYVLNYSSYTSNYNAKKYVNAYKALVAAYNTLFYSK